MKKVILLASAILLLSISACARKGACPAYGSTKVTPAVDRVV